VTKAWVALWAKYPLQAIDAMRGARAEMRSPSWLQRFKGDAPDLRMYLTKALRATDKVKRRNSFLAGGLRMEGL
jgi:hypothetical protein